MNTTLWTIQEETTLEKLLSTGEIVCTENKNSLEWDKEYMWMAKQMKEKIGNPSNKNQYPIWSWFQHESSKKRKPDLRKSGHLPTGTKGVRIEFSKISTEVVLSDFELWHYPLCYKNYIALNATDRKRFETKLKMLNLEDKPYNKLPKAVKLEIENSWLQIFNMNFEYKYYTRKYKDKMIQACTWNIQKEEILKIEKFVAK